MATQAPIKIRDADALDISTSATLLDNTHIRPSVSIGGSDGSAAMAPVSATDGLLVNLGANNDITLAGVVQVNVVAGGLTAAKAATATLANVSGSITSVTLRASNASRLAVECVNDSTAVLYVKYGSAASTTSFTKKVMAGEAFREDIYTGIITGIWESATGAARVTELTT